MNLPYAKIIVKGSPITKSNFKLHNKSGRAILPSNTGKSYDKYANYEEEISYEAKIQNPNIILEESLIAILKVYYKSEKRHPDTSNITKSIFDGIEKSGIIVNDMQIRKIVIEEFYDKENPRFELELLGESYYSIDYTIKINHTKKDKVLYTSNHTSKNSKKNIITNKEIQHELTDSTHNSSICYLCKKNLNKGEFITANKGTTLICKKCLLKTF
ncbi:MAG: RusA family crossover junction endodeoxyribonuclease [Sarcina sp.]